MDFWHRTNTAKTTTTTRNEESVFMIACEYKQPTKHQQEQKARTEKKTKDGNSK